MNNTNIINKNKFILLGSVFFVTFSAHAQTINSPFTVSGEDVNLINKEISIHTADSTNPIRVYGGNLYISNSSVSLSAASATTSALSVSTNGNDASNVSVFGSVDDNALLSTAGLDSSAVLVWGHYNNLNFDYVTINASGSGSKGIEVIGDGNNVTLSNANITSMGDGVYSNVNWGESILDLESVNISSFQGTGIYVLGTELTANNFTITTGINPHVGGAISDALDAYGVNSNDGAKTTLTSGTIATWGDGAWGIWHAGGSDNYNTNVLTTKNIGIKTNGQGANGIVVQKSKAIIDKTVINTLGVGATGVHADHGGYGATGAYIDVSNSILTMEGEQASGLFAGKYSTINTVNTYIQTSGASAYGARGYDGGFIYLTDNSEIKTTGTNAYGVSASFGSQIILSDSKVETSGVGAHGVHFVGYNNGNTTRQDNNVISIRDSSVTSKNGSAFSVNGGANSQFTIENSLISGGSNVGSLLLSDVYAGADNYTGVDQVVGSVTINAINSVLQGDILINSGNVEYILENGSRWTGAANIGANDRILNSLSLKPTSTWEISGNSSVNMLDNIGHIAFAAPVNGFKSLTVQGNYSRSGGLFTLNTKLGNDTSETDRIMFKGDVTGANTLQILNADGAGAQTVEGIKVIDVHGTSGGTFTLQGDYVHEGEQAVVGGAYAYKLYQGSTSIPNDGNWYLRSHLMPTDPVEPQYQAGAPVYEVYPQFLLGLNNLPTMQQRVGNRYWNNAGNMVIAQGADAVEAYVPAQEAGSLTQTNGVWGRIEGAHTKMEPNTSTTDANYDFNAYKMQAGLDGMVYENEQGKLIAGGTVHYTHGLASIWSPYDVDLGRGRIKTDGYGFGATLTWAGDDGFYVDNQAQLTWYRSELSYAGGKSELKDGKNNGFGYALSSEIGKRFTLDQHWSLTPQAQLQYSNVDFSDFTDVFGADVSRKKGDSLRGRLGLSVDYQNSWQNAQGLTDRSSVYGIVNLYNEFLSGTKVRVSTEDFINKSERFWGGIGFGGSYNWDNDKYSIYGEGSVNTSLQHFGDSYAYKGTLGLKIKW